MTDLDLSAFDRFNIVAVGVHRGIKWAIAKGPFSNDDYLQPNGYVELPDGHITAGLNLSGEDYDVYDVHGGITFHSDRAIGFDTTHYSDHMPYKGHSDGGRRWSLEEATDEVKRLAEQVADYHTPTARAQHARAEKLRAEANMIDPTRKAQ